jgi:AcrR family transcriptional regulator
LTTVKIAEAAGVAEGTIFRAFKDKSSLLQQACTASLDPAPTLERLEAIDSDLPLEDQLREAAMIIVEKHERFHALAGVLRTLPPSPARLKDARKAGIEANSVISERLTRLFSQHSDDLAVKPGIAAAAFRGLLYAVHPPLSDPKERITIDEAIAILLDGVLAKEAD